MKKRLHILLIVLFVSALGITACSDTVDPLTEDEQLEMLRDDIYDPKSDSGDEEDSIIDPYGS